MRLRDLSAIAIDRDLSRVIRESQTIVIDPDRDTCIAEDRERCCELESVNPGVQAGVTLCPCIMRM